MITIIANFYNSGVYIHKLLRSVKEQTFTDWELICVDDCSPGNDADIIKKTAQKLNITHKIKIIKNKTNQGISRAKKIGIDAANGEYITFIDGDDWFAPEALDRMYKPMMQYNLDMVVMNHYCYYTPFYKKECSSNILTEHWNKPLNEDIFIKHYLSNFFAENCYDVAYWAKMYRADKLKKLKFDFPPAEKSVREDFMFNMTWFQQIASIMFINYAGYYWRYGGITTGNKNNDDWSLTKYVLQNAEMYSIRKRIAEKYNYIDGLLPITAQLKNLLIWTFSRSAKWDANSPKSKPTKLLIRKIIEHPAYKEVVYLLQFRQSQENILIINSILSKDENAIYKICRDNYKASFISRMSNKIKHIIIYPFIKR